MNFLLMCVYYFYNFIIFRKLKRMFEEIKIYFVMINRIKLIDVSQFNKIYLIVWYFLAFKYEF